MRLAHAAFERALNAAGCTGTGSGDDDNDRQWLLADAVELFVNFAKARAINPLVRLASATNKRRVDERAARRAAERALPAPIEVSDDDENDS